MPVRPPLAAVVALAALGLAAPPASAQGPGLGNLRYDESEAFEPIGRIQSPRGHGRVALVRGYLLVIYSSDGGGSSGNGGIELWDVSDPRAPALAHRHDDTDTHGLREAHGFALAPQPDGGMHLAAQGVEGIQLWDLSDPADPSLLAYPDLEGIGRSDYGGDWWLAWQWPYVYVAGVGNGLTIVDARDPRAPVEARHVPTGELGLNPAVAFVAGQLLILAEHKSGRVASFDLTDPLDPRLLDRADGPNGYSHDFASGLFFTSGGNGDPSQMALRSVGHDGVFGEVEVVPSSLGNGGYGSYHEGAWISGFSSGVAAFDLEAMRRVGTGSGGSGDEDFGIALGNLIFAGNDHDEGSALIVRDPAPDARAPELEWMHPAEESVVPITARFGLSFSESVEPESVLEGVRLEAEGGARVETRQTVTGGLVNVSPVAPLRPETRYVLRIDERVRDLVGNAAVPREVAWTTERLGMGEGPLDCRIAAEGPVEVGAPATLRYAGDAEPEAWSWDFGDGRRGEGARVEHTWGSPGRHVVLLTLRAGERVERCSATQIVHRPRTPGAPRMASSVVVHAGVAYVANPDQGTVAAVDLETTSRRWEAEVGGHPQTLAAHPSGELWVADEEGFVHRLGIADGAVRGRFELRPGSRPWGLVVDEAGLAYLSLQGTGEVAQLHEDGTWRAEPAVPEARGLALDAAGERLWVTRFLSGSEEGEVVALDARTLERVGRVALPFDPGPDTEANGRGVPNYVAQLALSPDGGEAFVPAKKDNVARGLFRDGEPLTFESRVRAMGAFLDLGAEAEAEARRLDFNDRDLPQAALYSPLGDLVFVAFQGSNVVEAFDRETGAAVARMNVGRAPRGLALDPERGLLVVHAYLDRAAALFDVSRLLSGEANEAPARAVVPTAAGEVLEATVLEGKRIFYDASDERMSRDGYISCASCHLDGRQDGRVWDLTQIGEGLRNTITLRGRAGTRQGRLHWTANFDEVQDFEHDIRSGFGGRGFLAEADWAEADDPLGAPKAGRSAELDALAAYVASLDRFDASPWREDGGALTEAGARGRALFGELGCGSCHAGAEYTDGALHPVETLGPGSGQGLSMPLAERGLETPTLRGVWATPPYLHDGSAPDLGAVLDRHGDAGMLDAGARGDLVAFLRQIDGEEPGPEGEAPTPPTSPEPGGDPAADPSGGSATSGRVIGGCAAAPGGRGSGLVLLFALLGVWRQRGG